MYSIYIYIYICIYTYTYSFGCFSRPATTRMSRHGAFPENSVTQGVSPNDPAKRVARKKKRSALDALPQISCVWVGRDANGAFPETRSPKKEVNQGLKVSPSIPSDNPGDPERRYTKRPPNLERSISRILAIPNTDSRDPEVLHPL